VAPVAMELGGRSLLPRSAGSAASSRDRIVTSSERGEVT
jgi:hypothetical protein